VPNQGIASEVPRTSQPSQQQHAAHADEAGQLCKPEVTDAKAEVFGQTAVKGFKFEQIVLAQLEPIATAPARVR
jgi:hypothetical protein